MEVVGAAKGKPRRRQLRRQFLEVDPAFLEHHREPEPAFLVLEEKALAMRSWKAAAQCCRFRDGEDRRMRKCPVRDPELIETRKQLFRGHQRRRHRRARCDPASRKARLANPSSPAIIQFLPGRAGVAQG
jgi:hypothetical protein